ncbi:hypothetical protein E1293_43525, partial [Actinomadura darangshiensis]
MAFEGMPGHDVINVVRELEPVAAVRDQEAAERRRAFPGLVGTGPPEFGGAEQAGGVWRILRLGALEPCEARADLGVHLREAAAGHDAGVRDEMLRLAGLLAPEEGEPAVVNECAAGPRRYRIVRVLGFARFGDDGPEPARVTDGEYGPLRAFRIDPAAPVGPADAALRQELLGLESAAGTAYPGVVLLPPEFDVLEDNDVHWRPIARGNGPRDARAALAYYFRVLLPKATPDGCAPPSPGELAEYARAADRVEAGDGVEFVACGRRFRIAHVVRMIRVGPDGPE